MARSLAVGGRSPRAAHVQPDATSPAQEETLHAPHPDARHPLRGNPADRLRPAVAWVGADYGSAWPPGILRAVKGHRILHRRRAIPAWPRLLPAGAETAHRPDPERRLQYL